ncbi:hypothetical protein V8C86DRAFT_3130136 [Haematococcus lacustris]
MELNISISQLKRTCHQLGLERWPHRKLASLHQLRSFLEQEPVRDAHIQQAHLMRIELEMQRILNNPNHVIDPELLALRRYSWKRAQRIKNSASSSAAAFRYQQDQPDNQQERLQQWQWLQEPQWQPCLPSKALPHKHIKSVCTSELELILDSLASASATQPRGMQDRGLHYNQEAVHPVLKRNSTNPEQSARRYRTECGALESVSGQACPAAVEQDEDVRLKVRWQLGPQFCGESRNALASQARLGLIGLLRWQPFAV